MSDLAGSGYIELIKKVDRVLRSYQENQNNVLFCYESSVKIFLAEIDAFGRKLLTEQNLPIID